MYGLLDAEVEGVANQGGSDRHLVEERYLLVEEGEVVEVEVVAGVEAEATVACHACRLYEGGYGALAVGSIAGGVALGVELHTVGAGGGGMLYHRGDGIDEDGDAYAALLEACYDVAQVGLVAHGVPSGIARQHVFSIGHEGYLCGTYGADEVGEFVNGVAFDVELLGEYGLKVAHILIAYMALVGTRMDGDAMGTETLAVESEFYDIGHIAATGIAYGGDLIDVYT